VERSGCLNAKSPGRETRSIPGSSTEEMLVKAKSLGQRSFSSTFVVELHLISIASRSLSNL
jgi:hypothetical protein